MKTLLFFGDSTTEMLRERNCDGTVRSYGYGYPFLLAAKLNYLYPNEYTVLNRGEGGHHVADLYARVKSDVWRMKPDVLTVLVGVNDAWHRILPRNKASDVPRYKSVYREMLLETMEVLPETKIILAEPFALFAEPIRDAWEGGVGDVKQYAAAARELAEELHLPFLELQSLFERAAEKNGVRNYLNDGVHPAAGGAALIAHAWCELYFKEVMDK